MKKQHEAQIGNYHVYDCFSDMLRIDLPSGKTVNITECKINANDTILEITLTDCDLDKIDPIPNKQWDNSVQLLLTYDKCCT